MSAANARFGGRFFCSVYANIYHSSSAYCFFVTHARAPLIAEALLRSFGATVLGYLGASAAVAAIARLLHLLDVPRSEAVGWPMLSGFLLWLALALYTLCAQRLGAALLAPALTGGVGGILLLLTTGRAA